MKAEEIRDLTDEKIQAKIDGANVSWSVAQTLSVGSYTASEDGVAGYTASGWSGDCAADGTCRWKRVLIRPVTSPMMMWRRR